MNKQKYIVTSALPYANGKLHIGHVAGAYLPADIFVKYLKLKEKNVIYICGTDEHGAPISIKADSENVSPRVIVDRYHKSILKSFEGLEFSFDNFSGTAKPEHHKLSQKFFLDLLENGYINTKTIEQLYCENDQMYLADRYVEGICPHCKSEGARGDQCDSCGKLIDATKLIEPKCKICGSTPMIKKTKHWFLDLPKFSDQLKEWLKEKSYWKDNILSFINGLIDDGLKERAITRDLKWGVEVPLEDARGKVLYVWFDAPIGYISSTIEWAKKIGDPERWKDYWLDEKTKLIHFIGKDNNVFHALIWPAILMGQNTTYVKPDDIPANEFLNLEGRKLSTSKNWAIWVEDFLKEFDGEFLRFYLAAIAPETRDSDFTWHDFQHKINNQLANVLGNLVNRVYSFAKKYFNSKINVYENLNKESQEILFKAKKIIGEIEDNYDRFKVRYNVKLIIDIARLANKYFDEMKPWKTVKNNKDSAEETLYVCCELLSYISVVFFPIMPRAMSKIRKMLGLSPNIKWSELDENKFDSVIDLTGIGTLYPKINDSKIEKQLKKLKENAKVSNEKIKFKDDIDFDDFTKMDMRVAEIIKAEKIKKSKKLLKIAVKVGNEKRTVVSGIAKDYAPNELIGKKVVILVNLKPKKIMGIKSQGMILAAEDKEKLALVSLEKDIKSGTEVN